MSAMLSGQKAYELYTSNLPFPLLHFLDEWKDGKIVSNPGYVLAVINAYNRMVAVGIDGRYGNVRKG